MQVAGWLHELTVHMHPQGVHITASGVVPRRQLLPCHQQALCMLAFHPGCAAHVAWPAVLKQSANGMQSSAEAGGELPQCTLQVEIGRAVLPSSHLLQHMLDSATDAHGAGNEANAQPVTLPVSPWSVMQVFATALAAGDAAMQHQVAPQDVRHACELLSVANYLGHTAALEQASKLAAGMLGNSQSTGQQTRQSYQVWPRSSTMCGTACCRVGGQHADTSS